MDDQEPLTDLKTTDLAALDDDELKHSKMRGPLLGVKITGDINVPRGEYTFIVHDLGANGTIRIADEEPFKGARVVRGVAHIAGELMQQGKLIDAVYRVFMKLI